MLKQLENCGMINKKSTVLQGGLAFHFKRMGGDAYEKEKRKEKHFSNGIADIRHIPIGIAYIYIHIL